MWLLTSPYQTNALEFHSQMTVHTPSAIDIIALSTDASQLVVMQLMKRVMSVMKILTPSLNGFPNLILNWTINSAILCCKERILP